MHRPAADGCDAPALDGIAIEEGRPVVPAALLAARFGLSEAGLRAEMRAGRITSLVERGEGEDAGRLRLTVRHGARRWAVVVEPDGTAREVPPEEDAPLLFRMIAATRNRAPA